jgi:hypothetical protein
MEDLRSRYRRKFREATQRKLLIVNNLKSAPCSDCLNSFPPYCMDWDHIDPSTKLRSVGEMVSRYGLPRVMIEISKCDLVCRVCHRMRTSHRSPSLDLNTVPRPVRERLVFIRGLKASSCLDCCLQFSPEAMDFDHVRGEKVDNIARLKLGASMIRLIEEVAKCELVCANCHAVRTHTRDHHRLRLSALSV